MTRPLLLRLAFWLERVHCSDCQHIVWPWQSRCRFSHSSCHHAAMLATYRRYERGVPMWPCAFCGTVPE